MNIAVLVSDKVTGSNLLVILEAGFQVKIVIADSQDAPGIKIAKYKKIAYKVLSYLRPKDLEITEYRDQYSKKIGEILSENKIDVAILAGFNRILTKPYFETFPQATINIHPGAIPDRKGEPYRFEDGTIAPWNQGMMTEAAVANYLPLKFATSTIHIVTDETDFGPILKRVFVPVQPNDTVDTLYARLKLAENKGLIGVLKIRHFNIKPHTF